MAETVRPVVLGLLHINPYQLGDTSLSGTRRRPEELSAQSLLVDLAHGIAGQAPVAGWRQEPHRAGELVGRELAARPAPQLEAQRQGRGVLRPAACRGGLGCGGTPGLVRRQLRGGALGDDEGHNALAC